MTPAALSRLLTPHLHTLDRDELVPVPGEIETATVRALGLANTLARPAAWMFEVLDVKLHGSLARDTAIRTFGDVDVLLVLDAEQLRTVRGAPRTPGDTIARLAEHVQASKRGLVALGHLAVRKQDHSVGCRYPGSKV